MTELISAYANRDWGRDIDAAELCRVSAAYLRPWVSGRLEAEVVAVLAGLLNLNTRQQAEAKEEAARSGVCLVRHLDARLRQRGKVIV